MKEIDFHHREVTSREGEWRLGALKEQLKSIRGIFMDHLVKKTLCGQLRFMRIVEKEERKSRRCLI